ADHLVSGAVLSLQPSGAHVREIRWETYDNEVKTLTTDPSTWGAALRVVTANSDSSVDLPARGWTKFGTAYVFNAAGRQGRGHFDSGKLVVVVYGTSLGISLARDPGAVKLVFSAGNENFCAQFGGNRVFVPNKRLAARGASRPASCPA